ncbi:MAG: SDR family oxidoreductase [bacterium]|nr:SDR family oxidoreductase [bacterium]
MDKLKKVLVTGSNGYIGSLLVPLLQEKGYEVLGVDAGYFDDPECVFKKTANFTAIKKDVRDINESDLSSVDAICHLAALSNDPMGALDSQLTMDINLNGSIRLAKLAKESGVKKFLFSSSCSIYGALGGEKPVDEETPTDPRTAYAISKVEFEKVLKGMADEKFCPIILRNATAYGSSSKLRLDIVLNNFAANAFSAGEVKILSDGTPWRPMIHAEDIARLFVAFLETPEEKVRGEAINCGQDKENYQVKEIAQIVQGVFPKAKISLSDKPDKDSRSYRVSFQKLQKILPDFKFKWDLKKAAEELRDDFQKHGLPEKPLEQRHFIRLKQINHLKDKKEIDEKLYWNKTTEV